MSIKKCNKNICRFVLFLMNCCANINYVRRMRIFSLESFFQDASNGLGHSYTISFYLGAMERLKSMFFQKKNAFQFFTTTSWILSRSFPAVLRFLLFPFFSSFMYSNMSKPSNEGCSPKFLQPALLPKPLPDTVDIPQVDKHEGKINRLVNTLYFPSN